MNWYPHITVAAVVEDAGRFLMVEEQIGHGGRVFNQPAGHLEPGESLLEAVIRETREETAREFRPLGLVGIYRWQMESPDSCYIRFCFHGECTHHHEDEPLDPDILAVSWMDPSELEKRPARLRSPLVMRAIRDFQSGRRYPLEILHDL